MKLLFVEDNIQLSKALSTLLRKNNYLVDTAFDGEEALIYIKDYQYDLIILDIMLPKIDGLEVLKRMRTSNNKTPVILLTARSTIEDKITGLDLGADDYLAKPFSSDELFARIRALTRRSGQKEYITNTNILTYKDLSLDTNNFVLTSNNNNISLTNKEAQILALLMKANGKMVSQDNIVKEAWEIDSYSTSENVWVYISYLRKKLEIVKSHSKIKSIRYQGYYLENNND